MGEKVYGLLGRKLGHSWSAPIHAALGCADYRLIALEPEELGLPGEEPQQVVLQLPELQLEAWH